MCKRSTHAPKHARASGQGMIGAGEGDGPYSQRGLDGLVRGLDHARRAGGVHPPAQQRDREAARALRHPGRAELRGFAEGAQLAAHVQRACSGVDAKRATVSNERAPCAGEVALGVTGVPSALYKTRGTLEQVLV